MTTIFQAAIIDDWRELSEGDQWDATVAARPCFATLAAAKAFAEGDPGDLFAQRLVWKAIPNTGPGHQTTVWEGRLAGHHKHEWFAVIHQVDLIGEEAP